MSQAPAHSLETYVRERLAHKNMLLMTHAVVGFPSFDDNMAMLEVMQRVGADIVELQLPFSEPIADGPIFVRANQHALGAGVNWEQYFRFMERASKAFDFKILMMGYYNSVFQMGHETFIACLAEHGASGFIVGDLPPEEAGSLFVEADRFDLAPIVLMTPTNSMERLRQIAQYARGFVYCAARKGVTGAHTQIDQSLEAFIARCRDVTSLPLCLGFGLRSGSDLQRIRHHVDIAIVGTALLEAWEQGGADGYEHLLRGMVTAAA